jgi:hypothetical protein
MRCLFQVALTDSPHIAAQLLDQVRSLADEASQVTYIHEIFDLLRLTILPDQPAVPD